MLIKHFFSSYYLVHFCFTCHGSWAVSPLFSYSPVPVQCECLLPFFSYHYDVSRASLLRFSSYLPIALPLRPPVSHLLALNSCPVVGDRVSPSMSCVFTLRELSPLMVVQATPCFPFCLPQTLELTFPPTEAHDLWS